jgi:hypothetical protein
MLSKRIGLSTYRFILMLGFFALAFGLPLNKVVLSIATMWILLFTLLEANFMVYWKNIKENPFILPFFSFFAFYFLSLAWTEDFEYAFKDINTKISLIVIPLLAFSHQIGNTMERKAILLIFVFATFVTGIINIASYYHWWGNREYDDIRGMSLFISHIRFGLMVAFAFAISIYYFFQEKSGIRWVFLLLSIFFVIYTYYSQIISGFISILGIFLLTFVFIFAHTRKKWLQWSAISLFSFSVLGLLTVGFYLLKKDSSKIQPKNLSEFTAEGNPYYHNLTIDYKENGNPVYTYINTNELRREWNRVSKIDLDSTDRKGQEIHGTILHYMTSKGLTKDAEGVQKLSKIDIQNIENGISSILQLENGLSSRFRSLKNSIAYHKDPNGNTFLQRLEYWKTAMHIIQNNPVLGVGIGDINTAFEKQYILDKSKLEEKNRLRSHNQFFTFWVCGGVFLVLAFVFLLLKMLKIYWKSSDYIALTFWITLFLSFFIEDTLETQMGITFFALFFALFNPKNNLKK